MQDNDSADGHQPKRGHARATALQQAAWNLALQYTLRFDQPCRQHGMLHRMRMFLQMSRTPATRWGYSGRNRLHERRCAAPISLQRSPHSECCKIFPSVLAVGRTVSPAWAWHADRVRPKRGHARATALQQAAKTTTRQRRSATSFCDARATALHLSKNDCSALAHGVLCVVRRRGLDVSH